MAKNTLYISHPEIVKFPGTELSTDLSAAATTGSVLNNVDFASNNILLFGSYGNEETELATCTAVSGNTEIRFSAVKFAHTKGTIITKLDYDQYELHRSGTETGTFTVLRTASLSVDEEHSRYVDETTWSDAWYKYRYYDSVLDTYSAYSDAFQGTPLAYKENSLYEIRTLARQLSGTDDSDEDVDRLINHYQREICSQYNYGFMKTDTTTSAVANQVKYDQPDDCKQINCIRVIYGSAYYDPKYKPLPEFKQLQLNTSSSTIPSIWTKVGTQYLLHNPFSSLGTNNIVIYYHKYPARLDSDNDESPMPLKDALVNKVASMLCMSSNPEKSDNLDSKYARALNTLKAAQGTNQGESFPQVGLGRPGIERIIEIDT
jgi:hypothetical protein